MPISRYAPAAEVRAAVVRPVPEHGMSDDELIAHLRDVLIEWGVQCGHPRFLAYVTGSGTVPGAVVDMLASGVNMNVGGWQLSPSASEIEQSVVRWFAARFGMGDEAAGLLVSGGAMANMVGLKAARDHMAGWNTPGRRW
jgi:glutamate/tyrosine decarboxylase-like PLP-dependent enzyme